MPHLSFFKKKNTRNKMNNNNNTTSSSTQGLNAGVPTNNSNVDIRSVRKNGGKEKKNWKNVLLRLHQNIWSDSSCHSKRKGSRKSRNNNLQKDNPLDVIDNARMEQNDGDEMMMDYDVADDKEDKENNFLKDNVIQETHDDDVIDVEESRDRDIKVPTSSSSNLTQSKQQNDSENDVKKVYSRFTSTSRLNTKNIIDDSVHDSLLIEDSRDDEFDLLDNEKTGITLIEKCATIPRRSSETEVLAKKGRFTIIREADITFPIRTGGSNKSLSSSYSSNNSTISQSCSSSCSSLPVSLFDSSDSHNLKGSTKIRKNNEQLVLASIYSNSPISLFSPYYPNSLMCSPLSPSTGSHSNYYHNNNKNPRRASDSVAHHFNSSAQRDNKSLSPLYNKPPLSIVPTLPSPKSHSVPQQNITYPSPASSPQTSPTTTPTSTLVPKQSSSSSTSKSATIKPINISLISQSNTQTNRDSTSFPDTPHSTTSTISTTTSIVSTPSGRIFEVEGSYFPNNSVTPSSPTSPVFGSKRRRKFIVETCEN